MISYFQSHSKYYSTFEKKYNLKFIFFIFFSLRYRLCYDKSAANINAIPANTIIHNGLSGLASTFSCISFGAVFTNIFTKNLTPAAMIATANINKMLTV